MKHRRLQPPPPQDEDERVFARGAIVEAAWGFSATCPPRGNNIVSKGARGIVMGPAVVRDDKPFMPKRMVPVEWANGQSGEVGDRLLVLLTPRVTHWEYGAARFCGAKGGAMTADEADVTCRRCLHRIGIQDSV